MIAGRCESFVLLAGLSVISLALPLDKSVVFPTSVALWAVMQLCPQFSNIDPTMATCCQVTYPEMYGLFALCYLVFWGWYLFMFPDVRPISRVLLLFDPAHLSRWDRTLLSDVLLWKCDKREQRVTGKPGEFICLPRDLKSPSKANNHICVVAFRRLLFWHHVYLHCSQLRSCEKPSKHCSLIPCDPGQR